MENNTDYNTDYEAAAELVLMWKEKEELKKTFKRKFDIFNENQQLKEENKQLKEKIARIKENDERNASSSKEREDSLQKEIIDLEKEIEELRTLTVKQNIALRRCFYNIKDLKEKHKLQCDALHNRLNVSKAKFKEFNKLIGKLAGTCLSYMGIKIRSYTANGTTYVTDDILFPTKLDNSMRITSFGNINTTEKSTYESENRCGTSNPGQREESHDDDDECTTEEEKGDISFSITPLIISQELGKIREKFGTDITSRVYHTKLIRKYRFDREILNETLRSIGWRALTLRKDKLEHTTYGSILTKWKKLGYPPKLCKEYVKYRILPVYFTKVHNQ